MSRSRIESTSKKIVLLSGMDRRLKNDHGEATATLKQVTGKEKLSIVRKNVINVVTNTNVMPFRWLKSSYRCFYCYDVFQEPKDLKSHNEIHAPEKEIEKIMNNYWESSVYVDISNMRCKLCTDVAIDFHKIIDHLITVHRVSFDKDFGTCMSPFKLHDISVECVTCEKHYRTFGHLLVHSNKEHKGCSQLLCEICGQHFRHPSNLRDHVNKEHNKQTVECNLCGETLPSMNRMRTHMQHFHNKRYKCFKCADLFETHYKRSLHMMNVHKSRDEVKCQHCPKTFVFRSTMMRHVRETHLQEKNAVCGICGWKAFGINRLKRHMTKHSNERNYKCHACDKAFKTKKTMSQHYNNIHQKIMRTH